MSEGDQALAAIFYTGGTTGRPKGVMLSHRNLIVSAMSLAMDLEVDPSTVYLHTAPTFHVGDSAMTFAVTMKGGTHVVIPRFDPDHFMETVQTHRVTHCFLVPTMINMIVNHPRLGQFDLSSLRLVHYAGSPIATALLATAMEALPGCGFSQGYGLTETSPVISGLAPQFHTFAGPHAGNIASAGLPAHHAEVKIVSADGATAPVGTVGEIVTRGLHVMMGYWNDAELSAHTLRDGWMHTGDLGTLDEDGFLYVVDRLKDMIITGGENVYSAEVEGVLHKHPDVGMCAVIGVPDRKWGERVHAIVVPKPERTPGEMELLDHCRRYIAGYKCPKSIQIREEPLPLSGAGKILKHQLRRDYRERAGV